MKPIKLFLLALLLFALTGCAASPTSFPMPTSTPLPDAPAVFLSSDTPEAPSGQSAVTLFFRYLDEPYLATETRMMTVAPNESFEKTLVTELLSGPGSRSTALSGLFPPGTHVRATSLSGRTLFVILTKQIMNPYADERTLNLNDPEEKQQAILRRKLCMQSLVATITENCDVDEVQVLVEQSGEMTESLRLKQRYFLEGDPEALVDVFTRDASYLLSPQTAMEVILSTWQHHDWQRMYRYFTQQSGHRLLYEDFVTAMKVLPSLAAFTLSPATLNREGTLATFVLDATLITEGGMQQIPGRVIRLQREDGLWRFTLPQLTGFLEDRL